MKKSVIILLIAIMVLGIFTSFGDLISYVQLHKMPDGGYLDTPTVTARYGNVVETIYMQKLAQTYGKTFVRSTYFEEYLKMLKIHASYFKVPTWIHYTVVLSYYMKENGMDVDTKFLNAMDEFLNKNLKDYLDTHSYYQMIADGLLLEKLLGKDLSKSYVYKEASNVLTNSVKGKTYANAGITVLVALAKVNPKKTPRDAKIIKFIDDHISYINGDYMREETLFKIGLLSANEVEKTLNNPDISSPSQLFFYKQLCEMLKKDFALEARFKKFEAQRAPFGGYYNFGEVSSVNDSYWAERVLNVMNVKNNKDYWKRFASGLISSESAYPVNMITEYLKFALEMNEEYHMMSKTQMNNLIKAFKEKMDLSPALEAYYLATFEFDKAFDLLRVIQQTNYINDEAFMDIHTVLDRLFKGLDNMDSSKKDISYYYDYVQLLNFAHDFGYNVDEEKAKMIGEKFISYMKNNSLVDLNLLNAAWNLERNYGLTINKDFYISRVERLKDPKSGGYFYNTTDGVETFQSTYLALSLLKKLEK